MKGKVKWIVVLLLAASSARAENKTNLSVGGELRIRSETQLDYGPITGAVDDDSFILSRTRPHLDGRPTDGVRIFIQPQFSRAFAQEESTIAGTNDEPTGTSPNPNNVFDLHQGFLEFERIGGSLVSVKIGRQELVYGDERLVGAFGWSNIGRSFDAGKIRLGREDHWVDGFFSWNEKAAGNEYFGGIYESWKSDASMILDAYGLLLTDNDGDGAAAVTGLRLVTLGARLTGTTGEERIDYNLEGASQFGKTQPNNHLAFAGHVAGGYTFKTAWKPRLGSEYNFASGDDPGTSRIERFNNLFPTNHNKYGTIDFASWRNIHDIVAAGSIRPVEGLLVKLDYHLFLLPEPADGMFRSTGAPLRPGTAGASPLAGHEIDLFGNYRWNRWVAFLGGYSLFKGGKFMGDTGANGTTHFVYVETAASF